MKRPALVSALSTVLALTAFAAPTVASPSSAASTAVTASTSDRQAADRRVVSRTISFDVVNRNETGVACLPAPDRRAHTLRARLIGPARVVEGRSGSETFHVLVHDAGTGGWFWNLQGRRVGREQDYATRLAEKGETVVVLDRLGYDRSPLRDGDATCLGAQATMLGRVVQALYAGLYEVPNRPRAARPHASHVVLHGHGTGATVARLEAATYSDVQALVLMSPVSTSPSTLALQTLRGQGTVCLRGAGFAPYGETARSYRRLLFSSAPAGVQRAAVRQRNSTPCGDVASLLPSVLAAQGQAVDVPTLVLSGGADARRGGDGVTATGGARLVRRTFAGAGSALPLEKQAPAVRKAVLAFVGSLDDRIR
ncbi:MAG: Alpha/beta hydrolase family protein [Nocardioides sp.]|jgi:hypothetical protein|nr:Alpha/beta hydrolase family protein [Nocardioides sp.]